MASEQNPRLDQEAPFKEEDIRHFIRQMDSITGSQNRGLGQVVARFALEQIRAVNKFEESSKKLTWWLIGLTVVLVILTFVIAWFSCLFWRKG